MEIDINRPKVILAETRRMLMSAHYYLIK